MIKFVLYKHYINPINYIWLSALTLFFISCSTDYDLLSDTIAINNIKDVSTKDEYFKGVNVSDVQIEPKGELIQKENNNKEESEVNEEKNNDEKKIEEVINNSDEDNTGYDIFLLAGQSNTHQGLGYDPLIDTQDPNVYQMRRWGASNYTISEAKQPLDNHSLNGNNRISFAWDFAKLYSSTYSNGRKVLIIPCGYGGTGFLDNRWNKGDDLYEDAVYRVNLVLANYPGSSLKAILWHQGENDVYDNGTRNLNYETQLDTFIDDIRTDVGNPDVPFILGGMVPYWTASNADRVALQSIIEDAPNRKSNVAYVSPYIPTVIQKSDPTDDPIHYDAAGQRELAKRYFSVYREFR